MRYSKNGRGWHGNSLGHSLASRGFKSASNKPQMMNKASSSDVKKCPVGFEGMNKYNSLNAKDRNKLLQQYANTMNKEYISHSDIKDYDKFYDFVRDNDPHYRYAHITGSDRTAWFIDKIVDNDRLKITAPARVHIHLRSMGLKPNNKVDLKNRGILEKWEKKNGIRFVVEDGVIVDDNFK